MNDSINDKSKLHEVKHLFSGRYHFFEVTSGESQEIYTVRFDVSCNCRYMSVQGQANGKICSHVKSVFDKIENDGGIKDGK